MSKKYDRISAVNYADKWALSRNPKYYNKIYIATHTYDASHKKISEYSFSNIRFIHINDVGT